MDELDVMDVSQFEGLYSDEGYDLSTSANVYVPWYKCTLRCICEKEQPMSELDRIVCKCISRGINVIEDISFVLSLDAAITRGEAGELAAAGILTENAEKLELTEKGRAAYEKKSMSNLMTQEYYVFMNAVTGVWCAEEQDFVQKNIPPEASIRLSPYKTVIRDDIENHDGIRQDIQRKHDVRVISVNMADYNMLVYQKETILFYENASNHVLFAFYNDGLDQLDTVLGKVLLERYKRGEVLELLQAERHLRAAKNLLMQKDPILSRHTGSQTHGYLGNREIRELLLKELDEAESEIFIVSPWINDFVVNNVFLLKMEKALERGVSVTIGYSYISEKKLEQERWAYDRKKEKEKSKSKELKSYDMAKKMQVKFSKYPNFHIFNVKDGTHEKILSYDEKYILFGSYNLLSYDGGEQENYKGFKYRREGGILIEDALLVREIKEMFGVD